MEEPNVSQSSQAAQTTAPDAATVPETDQTVQETLVLQANNDLPSDKDTLGFEPYVAAMVDFLTNDDTRPPLVISIEGEWA